MELKYDKIKGFCNYFDISIKKKNVQEYIKVGPKRMNVS